MVKGRACGKTGTHNGRRLPERPRDGICTTRSGPAQRSLRWAGPSFVGQADPQGLARVRYAARGGPCCADGTCIGRILRPAPGSLPRASTAPRVADSGDEHVRVHRPSRSACAQPGGRRTRCPARCRRPARRCRGCDPSIKCTTQLPNADKKLFRNVSMVDTGAFGPGSNPGCHFQPSIFWSTVGSCAMIEIGTSCPGLVPLTIAAG